MLKALADTGRVGIARVTLHLREYTVFIRPRNHGLTIHTMYYENEIRDVAGYGKRPKDLQLKPQEIKPAKQLIETLSADFKPAQYHDTFQDQLRALVEAKGKGKTIAEHAPPQRTRVIDMMDALNKSLRQAEAKHGRATARRLAS